MRGLPVLRQVQPDYSWTTAERIRLCKSFTCTVALSVHGHALANVADVIQGMVMLRPELGQSELLP